MDLYSQKSKSIPQKTLLLFLEILLLGFSYYLLFEGGVSNFISEWQAGNFTRRILLYGCYWIVFCSISLTLFYLMKRTMPWDEAFSIPIAFGLYYIGFSFLGYSNPSPLGILDFLGIILFVFGSFLNTFSELQRDKWKKDPAHQGKLYTEGLFHYSMHINFFGDVVWVAGAALITGNAYSGLIVIFLFCFFWFYNIPMLDKHLANKYGSEFQKYQKATKRFVPFVL